MIKSFLSIVILLSVLNGSEVMAEELPTSIPPQRSSTLPSQDESWKQEAWARAGGYALTHPVVAISVEGSAPDATAEEFAQFLKHRFSTRKNLQSTYFTGREDERGMSVSFFVKDKTYGPVRPEDVPALMDKVGVEFPLLYPNLKPE